jgi:hypothetical protein
VKNIHEWQSGVTAGDTTTSTGEDDVELHE